MTAAAPSRKGWCPGVLRPMRAGDGLLLRVKPRGNRLTIDQALAVAEASRRFGNGVLGITGRANLQVRGVTDDALDPLRDRLANAGLIDPTPEGEAARNVLSSPLAGLDEGAPFDIRPFAGALEDALLADPALQRLPAKFNWNVDGGGPLGLGAVPGDVVFAATLPAGRPDFRVCLAGGAALEAVAGADLPAAARALAHSFFVLCRRHGIEPHRMADLVAVAGAAAVLAGAGLAARPGRDAFAARAWVGMLPAGPRAAVGLAPPFGRLEAPALLAVARLAAEAGAGDVRLAPSRSLAIGGLDAGAATRVAAAAARLGFIVDPADPRLAVAACAGAPACDRAGAAVQDAAAAWASLMPPAPSPGTLLHVSGCAKGCAHGAAAPVTLVARAGRYDLVRNGRAADPPEAAGLPAEAVAAILAGGIHTAAEAVA